MVTSLTALRTLLHQVYGVRATKIRCEGQVCLATKGKLCCELSKKDKELYRVIEQGNRLIFRLPEGYGTNAVIKPFPSTLDNLLLALRRNSITIVQEQKYTFSLIPENTAGIKYPSEPCNYVQIDIQVPSESEEDIAARLSQHAYLKSSKHEGRYRIFVPTKYRNRGTQSLIYEQKLRLWEQRWKRLKDVCIFNWGEETGKEILKEMNICEEFYKI